MVLDTSRKKRYLEALSLEGEVNIRGILGGEDPANILLVAMKRVGDLIVVLPAFRAIRDHFPGSRITVMSAPGHESLLRRQPYVDDFVVLPDHADLFYRQAHSFDLIISFRCWFPHPKNDHSFPPYFAFNTDLFSGQAKLAHLQYLDALSLLGIYARQDVPILTLKSEDRDYARRFFLSHGFAPSDIVVAIHPGSGYEAKQWPAGRYAEVVSWLHSCFKSKFVVIQGNGESEIAKECIGNVPPESTAILVDVPLPEAAAVLSQCTFFLGNDAGMMHLADAAGCSTITVFGPSRAGVWGASREEAVSLVRDDVWWSCPFCCSARALKDISCPHPLEQACLKAITTQDVCGAVESLAALTGLYIRQKEFDAIKVTDHLYTHCVERKGMVLTNLRAMKPLFVLRGARTVRSCLRTVERYRSLSACLSKKPKYRAVFDALLTYRIVLPADEIEIPLEQSHRRTAEAILSHPLAMELGIGFCTKFSARPNGMRRANRCKGQSSHRKSRILLANSIHHDIYGGGERWMVKVGAALVQRGHEVVCWGLEGHRWLSDAQSVGLCSLGVPFPRALSFDSLPALVEYLRGLDLDAAVLNLDRDIVTVGVPLRLAGVDAVFARKGLPHVENQPIVHWAYGSLLKGIITPSKDIKRELVETLGIHPTAVAVVPNGVESKRLRASGPLHDVLFHDLRISSDDLILLSVGRLVAQKGFHFLLEAMPEVLKSFPSAKLLVIGRGPLDEDLRKEVQRLGVESSVRFLGERWDIYRFIALADCYVSASLYEGMSTAMLEAMAGGLPVVATAVYGAREVITHKKTGLLVPPGKPLELARAICFVLQTGGRHSEITSRAYKHVLTRYAFVDMVDRIERLLVNR